MNQPADRPPRVRVTGPPRLPGGAPRRTRAREIDSGTALGEVLMRSLLREQLWLAGRVLLALGLTLGLVPLAFFVFPDLAGVRVGGIPISWLLLGVLAYPWLAVLGWWHVRHTEANERAFTELVNEAGEGSGDSRG